MKWLVKGDCHGAFTWLDNLDKEKYPPEETAIIILGDAGFNFFLNKTDEKMKTWINERGYYIYCVRGNHEQRPQLCPMIDEIWDENVNGPVYRDRFHQHIRYFMDYGYYTIGGYKCGVIGGAYSVDKWYRLAKLGLTEETNIPKKTGWFPDEQLTKAEMDHCEIKFFGRKFDFIFTHTCPLSFQPADLFLGFVDQSKVDNHMEVWLEEIKDKFNWNIWLFGHYHADRIERPHVEQYFHDIEELDVIWERWKRYDETGELDWWLVKSPNFYMT